MSTTALNDVEKRRKARVQLFLVFAVFAAPLIAAIIAFNFWRPSNTSNYGELLVPATLPALPLATLQGQAFSLESLRGKWSMLSLDEGACAQACQTKLYNLRQVRLAQGKHMDQVERVFLITDDATPPPDLLQQHQGAHFLRLANAALLPAPLQAADAKQRIFLIDPAGQLMMRYPPQADPSKMIKDLQRLLKVSAPD